MPRSISSEEIKRIADRILGFIRSEMLTKGYAPTVREIGRATGIKSTATVHGYLNRLEAMGFLRRDASKPRAIEILDIQQVRPTALIPILGQVTAGLPILAVENIVGYLPLPETLLHKGDLFALMVRGDSMVDAGILDGDYIYVLERNTADPGDIVVALLEDEATVKTFYADSEGITLTPANAAYAPIRTQDCEILGKVVGLFRKF